MSHLWRSYDRFPTNVPVGKTMWRDYGWLVSAPFFGAHLAAVAGVAWLGWS